MDNSSFPKILEFKGKTVPEKQLLRWKAWFEKYDFSVKHIKGTANVLADLLSRSKPVYLLTPSGPIPYILTISPMASHHQVPRPINQYMTAGKPLQFPPANQIPTNPTMALHLARSAMFPYLLSYLPRIKTPPHPEYLNPDTPFLTLIKVDANLSDSALWYIWCLSVQFCIALEMCPISVYSCLCEPAKRNSKLWTLLEWYSPLSTWRTKFRNIIISHNAWMRDLDQHPISSIFIVHRPYHLVNTPYGYKSMIAEDWNMSEWLTSGSIREDRGQILETLKFYLCQLNNYYPRTAVYCTSLGPKPGEFIPGEPVMPDNDTGPFYPAQPPQAINQPTSSNTSSVKKPITEEQQMEIEQEILQGEAEHRDSQAGVTLEYRDYQEADKKLKDILQDAQSPEGTCCDPDTAFLEWQLARKRYKERNQYWE